MEEITQKKIDIQFNPENHTYTVNGKPAKISVTTLIGKQIEKDEYIAVPEDVLKRAADRGTAVHADLEYYVGHQPYEPTTPECKNFANYIKANGWTIENPLTEFKLALEFSCVVDNKKYSFILCGTADLICILNGKHVVVDHKTTSVIHEESVRWQMSLLDYMARQLNGYLINGQLFTYVPAEEMYVFHFNKEAIFKPVKVEPISDVEIERLLIAEAMDEEYHPTPVEILTPRQLVALEEIEKKLTAIAAAKKLLEAEETKLKSEMLAAFEAHPDAPKTVDFGTVSCTYTKPTTRTSFDSEKFQQDHPDLYEQYVKVSPVKPSIRITLSKELKEYIEAKPQEIPLLSPPAKKEPTKTQTKRGFFT